MKQNLALALVTISIVAAAAVVFFTMASARAATLTGTFSNLDFENMGSDGTTYTSEDWTTTYGVLAAGNPVNAWNIGLASDAFLLEDGIDFSFDPSLDFLDGEVISGRYSFFLWGMHPDRYPDPEAGIELEIVELAQSGFIPPEAQSIRLRYSNAVPKLLVDGAAIPLAVIGPGQLAADISPYAGTTAEIRLRADPTVFTLIDDITLDSAPLPEPSRALLLILGAAFSTAARRRR